MADSKENYLLDLGSERVKVSIYILYTLLYTFPLILTWRIHLLIKAPWVGDHCLYSYDLTE